MKYLLLLILSIGFVAFPAGAEPYRRLVTFEWEEIEGAHGYEVEVSKKTGDKAKLYQLKTSKASWEGRLTPGNYEIKIRAFDQRRVPGEWSSAQVLLVNLDNVVVKNIQPGEQIKSDAEEKIDIHFKWSPVALAENYSVQITKDNGEKIFETNTQDTSVKVSLNVAQKYNFNISASNKMDQRSDQITQIPFSLLGKKLNRPEMEKPKTEFVREVAWSPVNLAENYDYDLQKFDSKNRSWKKFKSGNSSQSPLDFSSKWPGGIYALKVQAKANLREPSDFSEIKFKVRNGDRSPASEFNTLVRQSIDRVSKWYALFSYLMTEIHYSSTYYDTSGFTSYNALGGTLRAGLGYDGEKTNWGFLGILDYSGIRSDSNGSLTYSALETSAIYKKQLRERDEARLHMGLFMRELPATLANGRTSTYTESKISGWGPHLGAEYWYALTPKWGLQANLHIYSTMMKLNTPNGANVNPSQSMQVGFMVSRRSSPQLTYLFGYTRREDKIKYGQGSDLLCNNSACVGENRVDIEGNYLNFYAEYDF